MRYTKLLSLICAIPALALATGCSDGASASTSSTSTTDAKVFTCSATLKPMTMSYTIYDDTLFLAQEGEPLRLERVMGSTSDGVYGTWEAPEDQVHYRGAVVANNAHLGVQFKVERNKITITSTCSARGTTLRASTSSPAIITASDITITESHRDTKSSNGLTSNSSAADGLRPASVEAAEALGGDGNEASAFGAASYGTLGAAASF